MEVFFELRSLKESPRDCGSFRQDGCFASNRTWGLRAPSLALVLSTWSIKISRQSFDAKV